VIRIDLPKKSMNNILVAQILSIWVVI